MPPLFVAALALCLISASLAENPLYCACALGFVALGLPVFELFARSMPPLAPNGTNGQEQLSLRWNEILSPSEGNASNSNEQ